MASEDFGLITSIVWITRDRNFWEWDKSLFPKVAPILFPNSCENMKQHESQ